jgi:hypothetical protein
MKTKKTEVLKVKRMTLPMAASDPTTLWSRRAFLRLTGVGMVGIAGTAITGWPTAFAADSSRDPELLPGDAAHAWLREVYNVVWRANDSTPTNAARIYCYLAIAMYESVASSSSSLQSLVGQLTGLRPLPQTPPGRIDASCVMASTAREVTDYLVRSTNPEEDRLAVLFLDQISQRRAAGVPAGVVADSVDHGVRLGRALLVWIVADGYAGTVGRPYSPPVGESLWKPSPPNFGTAISPYWAEVRPMVLRSADEVTPVAHVPYSTSVGSPFWQQANTTYQTGLALTQSQRETAMFWRDNPHTSGLPSGHWMQIARQVCEQQQLSLARSVETYARLGVALHDAFLNCWTWKYRYNLIRPVDYVHRYINPNWQTWVATPAFPEYTSGHSVASAAASRVLTNLFGDLAFTDENAIPQWGTRQFGSFREAAQQAATSRLYGGIHYPMAIESGLQQGDAIGSLVVNRLQTRR